MWRKYAAERWKETTKLQTINQFENDTETQEPKQSETRLSKFKSLKNVLDIKKCSETRHYSYSKKKKRY